MNQEAGKNTRVLGRENLLTIYLPAATLAAGAGIAAVALPIYVTSFHVSVGVASQVFVAQLLGSMAATVPTGFLIDRFGRRKILLLGPALHAKRRGEQSPAKARTGDREGGTRKSGANDEFTSRKLAFVVLQFSIRC